MFDQTETACMMAGIAAVGAIYVAKTHRPFVGPIPHATECSARAATVVSARPASVEDGSGTLFSDGRWSNMTSEGEESMTRNASRLPNNGKNTQETRNNLRKVQPHMSLDTTGAKTIGIKSLIPGRCASEEAASKPPMVTGGCTFYMSDAYADRLMTLESQVSAQDAMQ